MSENPYQTPESLPLCEDDLEDVGDFGLMRSTSCWALLRIVGIAGDVTLSVFNLIVPNYFTYFEAYMTVRFSLLCMLILAACMWTYKTMLNAWMLGELKPNIKPALAVIYFFIPVLWFWKPYLVIKQIWDNLFGSESSKGLIATWWLCWLLGFWVLGLMILLSVGLDINIPDLYYDLAITCEVLSGILLIVIISKITIGQNKRIAKARR